MRKLLDTFVVLSFLLLASCNGRGSVDIVPSNSIITFIDIDPIALADLIATNADIIVLISSETCSSCQEFEPIILDFILLNHIPIYRIEANDAFPAVNAVISYEYTPTIVLFNEGEIVSQVDPFSDEEVFFDTEGLTKYFDRYLTIAATYKSS